MLAELGLDALILSSGKSSSGGSSNGNGNGSCGTSDVVFMQSCNSKNHVVALLKKPQMRHGGGPTFGEASAWTTIVLT